MGNVVFRRDLQFNGVKVFSATMVAEREHLGEKATAWLTEHPDCKVTEVVITQSSDEAYHCISITVFFAKAAADPR